MDVEVYLAVSATDVLVDLDIMVGGINGFRVWNTTIIILFLLTETSSAVPSFLSDFLNSSQE